MTTRFRNILILAGITLAGVLIAVSAKFFSSDRMQSQFLHELVRAEESLPPVSFLTTDPGVFDRWPSFSPDGKSIVVSRRVGFEVDAHLLVMPVERGGQTRRLTQAGQPLMASRPTWSKQGDLIVFIGTDADNASSLWLINADGTGLSQLEFSGLSDNVFYPSWYPDGERLAVVDASDHVIKRIDLRRGTVVDLTDPDQVYAGRPSVSPDGEWIAFSGQRNGGNRYAKGSNSIWLIQGDGIPYQLESGAALGRHPTWSPDGSQLAFDSTRGPLTAVFVINRDGTGLRRVTDYALRASEPVWSPDGNQLLVLAKYREEAGPFGLALVNLNK